MEKQTPTQFQALRMLYMSLIAGIIAFTLISAYMVYEEKIEAIIEPDMRQIVLLIFSGLALIMVVFAFYFFRKKLDSIRDLPIDSRMEKYRAAAIVRWAMIEFPVMLALIIYLLSREQLFFFLSAILLGIFITVRPSKTAVARDLGISADELESL